MGERGGRGKARTGPVTPEAVVDAALRVIDDDGLDALTMRRLAHDLGVEPVTIYRQLPNKEAILAGVAEKLWREMAPPGGAASPPPPPPGAGDWRAQVREMWLALDGLMQRHPNAIPIIARGGSYSPSAGEGTAGMVRLFKDAGLTPDEAAELLHILSACVVGFGFATLWGRQMAAAQQAAAAEGGPDEAAAPAADSSAGVPAADGSPAPADDLADYREAIAKWDPAEFAAALDIVLGAYGHGAGG
jgi:AcrR family transcriptional regulator